MSFPAPPPSRRSSGPHAVVLCLLSGVLSAPALAHGEFVKTEVRLEPATGAVALTMTGQTSAQPILQAKIQAQLYPLTAALKKQMGPERDLDWELLEPQNRLTYAILADQGSGRYAGTLERVKPGEYVLLLVDTTFQGESANAARAVSLGRAPAQVVLILPKTNTPTSYLVYALLGLLVPLVILGGVLGVAWLDRRGKLSA